MCSNKTKLLSFLFERDIQKIAKSNSQQENKFSQSQKLVPVKQNKKKKNRQSAKLNSRKNLVPHGIQISFFANVYVATSINASVFLTTKRRDQIKTDVTIAFSSWTKI